MVEERHRDFTTGTDDTAASWQNPVGEGVRRKREPGEKKLITKVKPNGNILTAKILDLPIAGYIVRPKG